MLFSIAAGLMAVALIGAAAQRPRVSLFVAAIMWGAYAVWEYYIAAGVLCDKDCNIRVDLVAFFPILAIATYHARRSYLEPSQALIIRGLFLSAVGLGLLAWLVWAFGYYAWSAAAGIPALALAAYAIKLKFAAKPM